MLQDLDARGGVAGSDASTQVRAVPPPERRRGPQLVLGAAAVIVLGAGAYWGWHLAHKYVLPAPPLAVVPAAAPPPPVVAAAPVHVAPVPAASVPVEPAAVAPVAPPVVAAPVAAAAAPAVAAAPVAAAPVSAPARSDKPKAAPASVAAGTRSEAARTAELRATASPQRELTTQQRAENQYRRALASLQEGRVTEAVNGFEQAVLIDPRHEAARQTLVGLLLESGRNDEAVRHLQLGLAIDPKQSGPAMILARLQVEKGGPAIDTLMRSLPYAGGNAEYLGFLAAVLQRAQRHREAIEQYQAALRLLPQNGLWWMGLGISLQAEQRTAEAQDAYGRAKAAGNLTPELLGFVERKLQLIGR